MNKALLGRWLLPAAGLTLVASLGLGRGPLGLPHAQTIHYRLGEDAPRVEEVGVRWSDRKNTGPEATLREATFRFGPGGAPRVITHEPRLADGDYQVEIDLVGAGGRQTVTRHVVLGGGTTEIELTRPGPR